MTPTIIIVGADKGGVGKTTIARTLIDYCREKTIGVRAFDTETPAGALKRFAPAQTEVIDITKSAGQMQVLDNLDQAAVTIVDIRAGLLTSTLRMLNDTGFFDRAKEKRLRIIVLHVLGGTVASFTEVRSMSDIMVGATHFIIKNHINENSFLEWNPELTRQINGLGEEVIDIPKLDELAGEHVDAAACLFGDFVNSTASQTLRGHVRHWMKNVTAAYDQVHLAEIIKA